MTKTLITILTTSIITLFLFNLSTTPVAAAIQTDDGKTSVSLRCNLDTGINTAIGCIPINDQDAFMVFLLRWLIGIAGGIGIGLIIYATFILITSQGNPDRVQAGQQLLTASIAGICFLIFSTFILRFFGVEVFSLPTF